MSLYRGVTFSGSVPSPATDPAPAAQPHPQAAPASAEAAPATPSAHQPAPSAALRFAPVIRSRPKPISRPPVSAAALLAGASTPAGASTIVAPPVPAPTPAATPSVSRFVPTAVDSGDVNGFAGTAAGQKLAKKNGRGKKRKGGQGGVKAADGFNPGREYDPARPTDYGSWKAHVHAQREKAREEREEARRRAREGSESSYYTEDEADDRSRSGSRDREDGPPRKQPRLFAPPPEYSAPPASAPALELAPRTESGADAYARRAAMSLAPKNETGDDAYARRMAMSRQGPPAAFATPDHQRAPLSAMAPIFVPTSQQQQSAPVLQQAAGIGPAFVPSSAVAAPAPAPAADDGDTEDFLDSLLAEAGVDGSPLPEAATSLPPSTSAPAAEPAPARPPLPEIIGDDPISIAQRKAREIAARLSALAKPAGPPPPPPEEDKRPFAEKMMARYGWSAGSGLGAQGDGMKSALQVTVEKQQGRTKAEKKAGVPPPPANQPRAIIQDSGRAERERKERERFGEPGKVVVLWNVCDPAEADEDLTEEVAEEARKHGPVSRCLLRILPGSHSVSPAPPDSVRLFLVMQGLASAWELVKSFEGRWFGGRKVRARFYEEGRWRDGELDGPLPLGE